MRATFLVVLRVSLSLVLLTVFIRSVFPAIRPSFDLDYSAWNATHIVLVEVLPEDGFFIVVESWKGDLLPGDRVSVPELKPLPGAIRISLYPRETNFLIPGKSGVNEQIPRQPIGSRVVLFLKKGEGSEVAAASTKTDSGKKWLPADYCGNMMGSSVWIDGEHSYGFEQFINPGPSLLSFLDYSLQQIKERVTEINRIRQQFTEVVAIEDCGTRAEGLRPFVRSELFEANGSALKELGKCGASAVEAIREMLDDPALSEKAPGLIRTFVKAGGEAVGEELNARLQRDVEFWRTTAPSLSQDWWFQGPRVHAPLRERYDQTFQLVLALEQTHYAPALITAEQLRDIWRSYPQMNDPDGHSQMADACDRLIDHLRAY